MIEKKLEEALQENIKLQSQVRALKAMLQSSDEVLLATHDLLATHKYSRMIEVCTDSVLSLPKRSDSNFGSEVEK